MKQEVRRGRKFVEYHDPDTQAPNTFTQEISGADVSYQDEGGSWQQLVEDWETDGQDGFSFRASRMNHKVRFDSIGAWRWYPRRNVETEYLVLNRPQCWLTATKRWGNLLVNGISREGKDITLTSVRNVTRVIHSRWNGIKTDWILLNANAPTRFRQKIDLVGITEIEGVLFGADGTRLAQLTPTSAVDADGAELACTGAYANGYVEFSADVTGAAFPVVIDPDFAGSTADGYLRGQSTTYSTARSTCTYIYFAGAEHNNVSNDKIGSDYYVDRCILKFDTSAIGAGSTVTQANIKLCHKESEGTATNVIKKFDWSSYEPIGAGNRDAAYDACLAADQDGTATIGRTGYYSTVTSDNLTTSWVSKTGTTYYGIQNSNDVGNTAPTGRNFSIYCSVENTTESRRPVLTVTYTAAAAGNPHYYYAQL